MYCKNVARNGLSFLTPISTVVIFNVFHCFKSINGNSITINIIVIVICNLFCNLTNLQLYVYFNALILRTFSSATRKNDL
jgi:hypothetical protein